MNSIKNTIVTVTLLAVGYGAYTVLSHPPTGTTGELSLEEPDWTIPAATEPSTAHVAVQNPSGAPVAPGTESPLPAGSPPGNSAENLATSNGLAGSTTSEPAVPAWPNSTLEPPSATTDPAASTPPAAPPADHGDPQNFYAASAGSSPAPADPAATLASVADPVSTPNVPPNGSLAGGSPAFEEAWKSIDSNLTHGQLADALFALTVWYEEPSLSPAQTERLVTLLDQLAGTVIYSRESFLEPAHVVQQGETLAQLAERYHVPQELLARINGIESPFELYPGETLKVVQGPFRAEVSRERGEVTLFLGKHYAGRFKMRIGADLPESEAMYEVVAKEPGRAFFDRRSGYRVERDDPSNPYGSVWLGLRGDQVTAAHNVGIHVDSGNPDSGCIAVSAVDAADLSAILSIGSRVQVKR